MLRAVSVGANREITRSQNHEILCQRHLSRARLLKRTRSAVEMIFKLLPPFVNDRDRWECRCISQRAESPASHVVGEVQHLIYILLRAAAVMKARQCLLEPVGPFATRNAPSATFVLIKLHDAQGYFHHTGLVVDR